jgi:hypothetical protein
MPFLKLLHKTDGFQWGEHATTVFIELKRYLKSLPSSSAISPAILKSAASERRNSRSVGKQKSAFINPIDVVIRSNRKRS